MANFTVLRNKAASFTNLSNRAAKLPTQSNNARVQETTIAKAVKSDATAKTSGGVFGRFIKQ